MYRIRTIYFLSLLLLACVSTEPKSEVVDEQTVSQDALVEAVLAARHQKQTTDLLSREMPDISQEQALHFQLAMLEKELAAGKKLIGYKMAGTAFADSATFNPLFGYILDENQIEAGSQVSANQFPGAQVMVEAEIGFKIKKDFPQGVQSMDSLKAGVEYVFGAIEFAQSTAIPIEGDAETMNLLHILAAGMAHTGIIPGSVQVDVQDFDFDQEKASCTINGEIAAEGISTNIYGNPLKALYGLANLLPDYNRHLEAGQIVITGSLYRNPVIDSTSQVSVQFDNLGSIEFTME